MGMLPDIQEALSAADEELGSLAQKFNPGAGDPVECGLLAEAERLETEADNLLAQAAFAETAEEAAGLAAAAERLFRQAASLRHQAAEDLQEWAGVIVQNEQIVQEVQGLTGEVLRGAWLEGWVSGQTAVIVAETEKVKVNLTYAAAAAADREQTWQCIRQIFDEQQRSWEIITLCQVVQREITDYGGRL